MSTQHTPGPWQFAADDAGPQDDYGCRDRGPVDPATYKAPGYYANIGLEGANGQLVVGNSEYDVFSGATPEERLANMYVLAAAPNLLANLEQMARLVEQYLRGDLVQWPASALPQAHCAIALAKGEPLSLRDVIARRAPEPKPKTVRVHISNGTREQAHSTMDVEPAELTAMLWAIAADGEIAYWFAGLDGWNSNRHMHGTEPPQHLRGDVERIRSARNYCPDCYRHKPNLTGPCGNCGAGI